MLQYKLFLFYDTFFQIYRFMEVSGKFFWGISFKATACIVKYSGNSFMATECIVTPYKNCPIKMTDVMGK